VRIELATLREGRNELTITPSPESLDVDAEIFSDIRVELEIDAAKDSIIVRYSIIAEAHLVCDRTAQPFQEQVEGAHLVMFTTSTEDETSAESADTKMFADTDQYLDLTDEVRDTLVLSLPVRRIAPGAEELDIPTTFGVEPEDEPDPRWDELRKLQN
ncbi:MAG: DUF177 domain-containing protein, partial [Silicimonas sp.]|nr:DUF177 domain-containing protein [Silicimonas sp.]